MREDNKKSDARSARTNDSSEYGSVDKQHPGTRNGKHVTWVKEQSSSMNNRVKEQVEERSARVKEQVKEQSSSMKSRVKEMVKERSAHLKEQVKEKSSSMNKSAKGQVKERSARAKDQAKERSSSMHNFVKERAKSYGQERRASDGGRGYVRVTEDNRGPWWTAPRTRAADKISGPKKEGYTFSQEPAAPKDKWWKVWKTGSKK